MNKFLILDSIAIFGILFVIIAILIILILIFVEQKKQTNFFEILNKPRNENKEYIETKNDKKTDEKTDEQTDEKTDEQTDEKID
jgi:sortase (surface protein transpeptidase)